MGKEAVNSRYPKTGVGRTTHGGLHQTIILEHSAKTALLFNNSLDKREDVLSISYLLDSQCWGKEILGDDIGHFFVMEKGCIFSSHFLTYGFIDNT